MSNLPINLFDLIGMGTGFGLAGLFYKFHQDKTKDLRKLQEIPIFKPDQHLLELLKASGRNRFQYVAVEGLVQADEEPLASEFGCKGVVQKISELEHWQYWNSRTKKWGSRRSNLKQTNQAVPFSLVEAGYATPGDIYVKVHDPLKATGLYLERVHSHRRHAAKGGWMVVLNHLHGERAVAKEDSEDMLRVGTTVTGFGELVLEADAGAGGRVMRLQAPKDGRPYILVPTDYKSYVARQESSASPWKSLAVACAAMGTTVLAGTLYDLLMKHDDK